MGCLLDGLASALRNLPAVVLTDAPRMIEFAEWSTASEEGLGLKPGTMMEAYKRNLGQILDVVLDSDLAESIIKLSEFKGTAKELAKKLNLEPTPHGCKKLVAELRELTGALGTRGIIVDCDGPLLDGRRIVKVSTLEKAATDPSPRMVRARRSSTKRAGIVA